MPEMAWVKEKKKEVHSALSRSGLDLLREIPSCEKRTTVILLLHMKTEK